MELEKAIEKLANESVEYADIAENVLEGKGKVAEDCKEYVEAINVVLNHLKKQEKMIDLMADWIGQENNDDDMCMYVNECNEKCGECVKQYFEKKAEESE